MVGRIVRAGALGGFVASLLAGAPYYFALRDSPELPWLQLAPTFIVFLTVTGALYSAGAAHGAQTLVSKLRPRDGAARALVTLAGATLGAAAVGPLPGSLGLAYFGSLPYPFMGTGTIAIAPFAGTAFASFSLAASTGRSSRARAAVATLGAAALFCAVAVLGFGSFDDETVLASVRSATTTSGHEGSPFGLGVVGLFVGALLGAGLGAQMGISAALSGGREPAAHAAP